MRRKQKKLLKRIVIILAVVAVLMGVVKSGVADSLLTSMGSIGSSIKGLVDQTTDVAGDSLDTLKKIYEEYTAETVDSSSTSSSKTTSASTASTSEKTEKASDEKKDKSSSNVTVTQDIVEGLEIPSYIKNHQVVQHDTYTLSYNEDYEQADWVAYTLTTEDLDSRNTSRSEDFREDEDIETDSAHLSDYRGSGYDRGHLLSSANRVSSAEVNSETFLLSNMSPMLHRFNAGLFLKAEDAERDAARQYGTLYIVTGPVFSDDMETIGECDVAVPKEYYKVFLGQDSNGEWHAIGMILPQEYTNGNLKPYFKTVDEVEKATGLDFFPSLNDSVEKKVESEYDLTYWPKSFK